MVLPRAVGLVLGVESIKVEEHLPGVGGQLGADQVRRKLCLEIKEQLEGSLMIKIQQS